LSGIFILLLGGGEFLPATDLHAFPGPETAPSVAVPDLKNQAAALREPLYRQAVNYLLRYRRDDLGQAVRLFNQILKTSSDFAPALGGVAEARALRFLWGWEPDPDRLKQALDQGKRGVELGPDLAETHLGLGLAYMAADRYTPALAEMDRAVEMDPGSFRAHLYRGMVLRGLRRTEELGAEATRLLQIDPSSAVAYSLLGDYYQDSRRFEIARESYLTAALLDQHLLWPRQGLAAAYQKEMQYGAAAKTYDATEHDFPEEQLRVRIMAASLLIATQNYEDALKIYEAISEKESFSPPLLRRLMRAGRAYALEKLGREEKAEYYWTQLVEEFPEAFDGAVRDREVVSQGYEGLVRYYDGKGNRNRSTDLLERACRQEGMDYSLYAALAGRRQASGDLKGAVSILRKGLLGAPAHPDLVTASEVCLSAVRGLGTGKATSATRQDATALLDDLGARISRDPVTSHVPYLNLARSEALLGREMQALTYLRKAMDRGFRGIRDSARDPDFNALSGNRDFRELTTSP
jgi:tetratricopeptide (TPR) repeat protein